MKNIFLLVFNPEVKMVVDKNRIKVNINGEEVLFPMIMSIDLIADRNERFKENFIIEFMKLRKNSVLKFSLVKPVVEINLSDELKNYSQVFVDIFKETYWWVRELIINPGNKRFIQGHNRLVEKK